MAERIFLRTFDSFKGLDSTKNYLSRDKDAAIECTNIITEDDNSLTQTNGFISKSLASLWSGNSTVFQQGPKWGLHRRSYQSRDTGESKEELLGMGNGLWVLRSSTFKVTGPTDSALWQTILVDKVFEACLREDWNGSSAPTTTLENSTLSFGPATYATSIAAFVATIQATSGFGATELQLGVINGNQTAITHGSTININSGHNLALGLAAAKAEGRAYRIPFQAWVAGGTFATRKIVWADVIATAATTITIAHPRTTSYRATAESDVTFDLKSADLIGPAIHSYFNLEWKNRVTALSASAVQFEYFYWEPVFREALESRCLSIDVQGNPNYKYYNRYTTNYVAKDIGNCTYIGEPQAVGVDIYNDYAEFGLVKYDGSTFYTAGLPTPSFTASAVAGAGLVDGRYKYVAQFKKVDRQGNIVYGNPSLINGEVIATCLGGSNQVILQFAALGSSPNTTRYPTVDFRSSRCAAAPQTLTTGSTSRTLNLVATPSLNELRVGDIASYLITPSNEVRFREVLDVTATTLTLKFEADEPTESLVASARISNGNTLQIYRTKPDGQSYYLAYELIVENQGTAIYWPDILPTGYYTDGIEWDGPFLGQERRDPPPPLPILETHQGLLVGGGYKNAPNTIAWSTQYGNEYFPRGTNVAEILTGKVGQITAIASADGDSLLCFKESALAVIGGDFYSGVVFPTKELEGDIGCPSPTGWTKAREAVLFFSKQGLRAFAGGTVNDLGNRLQGWLKAAVSGPIGPEERISYEHTTTVHDIENQRVLFYVPQDTGPGTDQNLVSATMSTIHVFDYAADFISQMRGEVNALGGMAWYGGKIHRNEVKLELTSRASQSGLFVEAAPEVAIFTSSALSNSKLVTQWEFMGEPSFLKDFMQVRLWLPYAIDGLIMLVTPEYGYQDANPVPTPISATWTSGKLGSVVLLQKKNAESISLKLTTSQTRASIISQSGVEALNSTHRGTFKLLGYEVIVNVPYKKERVDQTIS